MVVGHGIALGGFAAGGTIAAVTPPLATPYQVSIWVWTADSNDSGALQLQFNSVVVQANLANQGGLGPWTAPNGITVLGPFTVTTNGANNLTVTSTITTTGAIVVIILASSLTAE